MLNLDKINNLTGSAVPDLLIFIKHSIRYTVSLYVVDPDLLIPIWDSGW
jgi:hypothetical protein